MVVVVHFMPPGHAAHSFIPVVPAHVPSEHSTGASAGLKHEWPIGQGMQAEAFGPLYVPLMHESQDDMPNRLTLPASHSTAKPSIGHLNPASQVMHSDGLSTPFVDVPSAQGVHDAAPNGLYEPLPQSVGVSSTIEQAWPAGHGVQTRWPV